MQSRFQFVCHGYTVEGQAQMPGPLIFRRHSASCGNRASNLRRCTRVARAMSAALASIPDLSVAQVRVTIRLPPCPLSIRRIVVPMGSDGVTPPSRSSAQPGDFLRTQFRRHGGIQKQVHQPAFGKAETFQMPVVGKDYSGRCHRSLGRFQRANRLRIAGARLQGCIRGSPCLLTVRPPAPGYSRRAAASRCLAYRGPSNSGCCR